MYTIIVTAKIEQQHGTDLKQVKLRFGNVQSTLTAFSALCASELVLIRLFVRDGNGVDTIDKLIMEYET